MAIQRMLARSGNITPDRRAKLDAFFGSTDWWDQAYETSEDLLGAKILKLRDSSERLLEWYRERLRQTFGLVSVARLVRNTKGGHLYDIVWAGRNLRGLKGADYILKMGEVIEPSV
jgi:hypothetical protein